MSDMRTVDRMSILDAIGRELQSRMSFADLDIYLKAKGVNTKKDWSGINSKWVYTKEMLADAPDGLIIEVAKELEIDQEVPAPKDVDSKFWTPGFFRLFISHVSKHKLTASNLQRALKRYAVSSFVAHEDIEPTREWLIEIEKALFSMDALAAIMTPEFPKSEWTDHEVGIAIGRETLVLPIRKGKDPYGFIGKYQGLQSLGKSVSEVARETYQILATNPKTSGKVFGALTRQLLVSSEPRNASHWLDLLVEARDIPVDQLEKLQASVVDNEFLMSDEGCRANLKTIFERQGLSLPSKTVSSELDEDVPF